MQQRHALEIDAISAKARYAIDDGILHRFGQAPPDVRTVRFCDMRANPDPPQLWREGFVLVEHESALQDFEDAEAVAKVYLPEIQAVFRQLTGASMVFMQSNWVVRAETREFSGREVDGGKHVSTMKTGGFVHVDYDPAAAERWAFRACVDAGVPERPAGRLVVLTAWRSFSPPPQDKPLALIDRRTVDPEDLILEVIQAPQMTWNGYQLRYNPRHRFCWWSDMRRSELLVFLQHQDGAGPVSAAPHTAFDDLSCDAAAGPRHSIEVRGYAFLPG